MKFALNQQSWSDNKLALAEDFGGDFSSLVDTEDMFSFVKKLVTKIGTFFGMHKAMAVYIKNNEKIFHDLNPEEVVNTVMPADLTIVANAAERINEGLEKLRLGEKIDLSEFVDNTLELAGIEYERGRISIAKFKSGSWGEGKNKTGLSSPMTFHKTIDEFGWKDGAWQYCERFIKLCDTKSKSKLIDASNRHYADVKNAMARGIGKNMAVFEKETAIDQINQLNVCRNVLLKFYFKQLRAIMKGAYIQPIGEPPKDGDVILPNTYTGK